jgi:hypothetical protein
VEDAEHTQQRPLGADRGVGGTVVAHLDDAVAQARRLDLGERPTGADGVARSIAIEVPSWYSPAIGVPRAVSIGDSMIKGR